MLKLMLQYFGHLMRTTDSLKKTPMLGKIEGRRRGRRQRMRWLRGITNSMDTNLGTLQEMVRQGSLASMGLQRVERNLTTEHTHTQPFSKEYRIDRELNGQWRVTLSYILVSSGVDLARPGHSLEAG